MNFLEDLVKNIGITEHSIPPGGSGAEPPTLANFCDFSLNFPLATFVFPYICWSALKTKDNNLVLEAYGRLRGGGKPPERSRKF